MTGVVVALNKIGVEHSVVVRREDGTNVTFIYSKDVWGNVNIGDAVDQFQYQRAEHFTETCQGLDKTVKEDLANIHTAIKIASVWSKRLKNEGADIFADMRDTENDISAFLDKRKGLPCVTFLVMCRMMMDMSDWFIKQDAEESSEPK